MLFAQTLGSDVATSEIGSITPALLTRMSSPPSRALVSATTFSTAA